MRLVLEMWVFGTALAIVPFWTKWYLPVDFRITKYLSSKEVTISLLWLLHFSVRFPSMGLDKELAKRHLPRTRN